MTISQIADIRERLARLEVSHAQSRSDNQDIKATTKAINEKLDTLSNEVMAYRNQLTGGLLVARYIKTAAISVIGTCALAIGFLWTNASALLAALARH